MASYAAVKIRIADEIERYLNVASWLREALENEMTSGLGEGKHGTSKEVVAKWNAAVQAFANLTNSKIRLDKSAKMMADTMTPEEEREAVRAYIRSLPPAERGVFLRQEQTWHATPC